MRSDDFEKPIISVDAGSAMGPGMQEMLYPTSYLKSTGLGKACSPMADVSAVPQAFYWSYDPRNGCRSLFRVFALLDQRAQVIAEISQFFAQTAVLVFASAV